MQSYRTSKKFTKWVENFTKKGSKTYGNATQSALAVYDTHSYSTAAVIGHKNLKKHNILAKMLLEKEGYTFEELIKLGVKKVVEGKYQDWESFMKTIGYFSDKPEIQQNNQFNFHTIGEVIRKARTERGLEI